MSAEHKPLSAGLATELRTRTKDLHTLAEKSGVMRALLRGELARDTYCRLLSNLQSIYSALESALDVHARRPCIAPIYNPALFRERAIAADLHVLCRADHLVAQPLTPATRTYVDRLHYCASREPDLLVAHAYVRYLGDLSGGQLLRKIVQTSMGIEDGNGIAFYDFGDRNPNELATEFRIALDNLPADKNVALGIVSEAQWAFTEHAQLFEELAKESA